VDGRKGGFWPTIVWEENVESLLISYHPLIYIRKKEEGDDHLMIKEKERVNPLWSRFCPFKKEQLGSARCFIPRDRRKGKAFSEEKKDDCCLLGKRKGKYLFAIQRGPTIKDWRPVKGGKGGATVKRGREGNR